MNYNRSEPKSKESFAVHIEIETYNIICLYRICFHRRFERGAPCSLAHLYEEKQKEEKNQFLFFFLSFFFIFYNVYCILTCSSWSLYTQSHETYERQS